MKTTLMIDDSVMARLREEAARRRTTISALVEGALRTLLEPRPESAVREPPPLPVFDGGKLLVDIADREALYDLLDRGD